MPASPIITAVGAQGAPIPVIQLGTSQNVSYNAAGGASTQSAAFGANTTLVMVSVNVATGIGVRIATGTNPTASSTTTLLPASGSWYFCVEPAWKLAVLSNDTNTGTINITEAAAWG